MGCDIHAYIENKSKYSDNWYCFAKVELPRWYMAFGRLAGVRCNDEPHIAPRGIPANASYEAKERFEEWGCDAHSASWLTAEEFSEAIEGIRQDGVGGPLNEYGIVGEMLTRLALLSGARIVFWFDN